MKEAEPQLKNFIVTVDWGDKIPAYHFFQAESWESLEASDVYINEISKYPPGLEMTVYLDIPDKLFNEKLRAAKKLQKAIDARNTRMFETLDKECDRMEKEGMRPIAFDMGSGELIGFKLQQHEFKRKGRR